MQHNIYLYIMVSALVSFAVRAVPLTLIRKKIENPFLKSFLFYVQYVTLSVMTFPAIVETTAANTITQHITATRNILTPFLAATIPAISASTPAIGTAVVSTIAGKVMTDNVTYGT